MLIAHDGYWMVLVECRHLPFLNGGYTENHWGEWCVDDDNWKNIGMMVRFRKGSSFTEKRYHIR